MNKFIKTLLLLLFVVVVSNAQTVTFPLQKGFINDYEGLFTPQQQIELNTLIAAFEKQTNREIAVVTLNDIKPYSNVSDYSKDLSYNWSLYKEELQSGLLMVVSKTFRTVRIMTAYGTHQLIQDDVCRNIINKEIIPACSQGDYFLGTKQGLSALMREWK